MKTLNLRFLLVAVLINVLMSGNAWANRILISDTNQTVTLQRALDCYDTADIAIRTSQPEIYEQDSKQLQLVSDTIRAMLIYECPELSKIKISGLIRGLDEIVYQVELSEQKNWLLPPDISSMQSLRQTDARDTDKQADLKMVQLSEEHLNAKLSITNLKLGMSTQQASKIVKDIFSIQPEFHADRGLMTMRAGGCPEDFYAKLDTSQVRAEWKCLDAWFTNEPVPRLTRLELVQVVKTDVDTVQRLLVNKYGQPGESKSTQFGENTQLIWRAEDKIGTDSHSAQSLIADLSNTVSNQIITRLTLFNPDEIQSKAPYAGIDLQL